MTELLFTLTYIIDNEVYKTYTLTVDDVITPEPEPTKDGYTFSGWSDIPKKMPCYDVIVRGSFTKNNVGIDECVATSEDFNKPILNLRGQRVINPKNGIYIINGKKVFIKK